MSKNQHSNLPETVVELGQEESFNFDCHPGVSCFTECCRMLELALTPYDVLRLRKGTGLTSRQLHEQYIIEELEEGDIFPRYYLTMVDDGRASCAFVSKDGCSVYQHRPGACRAYPLGRAVQRTCQGHIHEHHVLVKEPHCCGFEESQLLTADSYSKDQGLDGYNSFNDAFAAIFKHKAVITGRFSPSREQRELYALALYDIDTFRQKLKDGDESFPSCPADVVDDDEKLLLFAIDMVRDEFFPKP